MVAGGLLLAGWRGIDGRRHAGGANGQGEHAGRADARIWQVPGRGLDHLPSIGVHNVEIPVPAPGEVEATQKRLADHKLTAILLTGKTDLSKPECVAELAGQLKICNQMGVRRMFLSAKLHGAGPEVVYDRLRQAGDIARQTTSSSSWKPTPSWPPMARWPWRPCERSITRTCASTSIPATSFSTTGTQTSWLNCARSIDYVGSVHLKETDGGYESWHFPALGKGVVDFPACRDAQPARLHRSVRDRTRGHQGRGAQRGPNRSWMCADSVAYLKKDCQV